MHENNTFLTLTYDDKNLGDGRLHYEDFQKFMKRLRDNVYHQTIKETSNWHSLDPETQKNLQKLKKVGFFVTGEYGDATKRPHWHAIVFNWRPATPTYHYTSKSGHKVYKCETLDKLWPHGFAEFGDVTFESAGYVARYAAKKLAHGEEVSKFEPISKKSNHQAIGKTFLEKFWKDVFQNGECLINTDSGIQRVPIPRYYEKWLQKYHPNQWEHYVTQTKLKTIRQATNKSEKQKYQYNLNSYYRAPFKGPEITHSQIQKVIIEQRFKLLQSFLKGD